jgi:hypothetical protein
VILFCQTQTDSQTKNHSAIKKQINNVIYQHLDTLFVKLKNGKYKKLINNREEDGNSFIIFNYRNKLKDLPFHYFDINYYEGTQVLLVDERNGNEYYINDEPKVSPDNKFIATASFDLDASYNPNELNIWRIDPDSLSLVFSIKPNDWGPSNIKWINNSSFNFAKNISSMTGEDSALYIQKIELLNNTWELK